MAQQMTDDDLVSTAGDLADEVGVGKETAKYLNEVEEDLDEEGELTADQRVQMGVIIKDLSERKARGDVLIEEVEGDDDEEDDLEGLAFNENFDTE